MLTKYPTIQMVTSSSIIYPKNDQVRARRVIFISNNGHPCKFGSLKCGRILHLESGVERDWATILEFDPTVIIFYEQPFRIEYFDAENKKRSIFPDFLVYYDNGSVVVVEIKLAADASEPENKQKFELEKQILEYHGYGFKLITDEDMENDLLLSNSKKLRPYRRTSVDIVLRKQVLGELQKMEMSEQEMLGRVYGLTHEHILSMLSQSLIATDLSLPLTQESLFFRPKRQSKLLQQQLLAFERVCV